MAEIETLTAGYGLIEGPVWHPEHGLFFSDVLSGSVFQLNDGAVEEVIPHRRGIGGMAWHVDGGLVVSGRNIAFKRLGDQPSITILDRNEDAGLVGFNDITADAAGRIYAGGLGASPVFADGRKPRAGDLWLIELDGSARIVMPDIQLTNGLGFSPDGRTLYHSDSRRRAVNCYEVALDGSLSDRRVFVTTDGGIPDGLVVDAAGVVWVALADGGQGVAGYSPEGKQCGFISIPEPMCTSVCFGGADLRDLYIVSGSQGSGREKGGAVHRLRMATPGLPVPYARVKVSAV